MNKNRVVIDLGPEAERALDEYTKGHQEHFSSASEAASHLLCQVLLGHVEGPAAPILPPKAERTVLDAELESVGRRPRSGSAPEQAGLPSSPGGDAPGYQSQ